MKFKAIVALAIVAGLLSGVFLGCSTTSQRTAYTTISSVDSGANAAIDGYFRLVAVGTIPTNSVPKVAKAYDDLKLAEAIAATAAAAGTNALAPATLTAELGDLLALISAVAGQTTISSTTILTNSIKP